MTDAMSRPYQQCSGCMFFILGDKKERIVNVRSEDEKAIVIQPNPFLPVQLYETTSLQMVEGHLARVCTVTFLEEVAPANK